MCLCSLLVVFLVLLFLFTFVCFCPLPITYTALQSRSGCNHSLCMPIRGPCAWEDTLLMHGTPLTWPRLFAIPWTLMILWTKGFVSYLVIFWGQNLMYAWDQISLIRSYTELQAKSGCNRFVFMHDLRCRHPRFCRPFFCTTFVLLFLRIVVFQPLVQQMDVCHGSANTYAPSELNNASDIREMQSARTTCEPWVRL